MISTDGTTNTKLDTDPVTTQREHSNHDNGTSEATLPPFIKALQIVMNVFKIFKEAKLFFKDGIAIFCRSYGISYYINPRGGVIYLIFGGGNLFLAVKVSFHLCSSEKDWSEWSIAK